ncbi:MAG: hypothetical protein ACFBZ8_05590 [Opitutales bacterium]
MTATLRRGLAALTFSGLSLVATSAQASIFQPLPGQTVQQLSSTLSITVTDPDSGLSVTFDNFSDFGLASSAFDEVSVVVGTFVPTGQLGLSFVLNDLIASSFLDVVASSSFAYTVSVEEGFVSGATQFLDGTSVNGLGGTRLDKLIEGDLVFEDGTIVDSTPVAALRSEQHAPDANVDDLLDSATFFPQQTIRVSDSASASTSFIFEEGDPTGTAHLSAFIQAYQFQSEIPEPAQAAALFGSFVLVLGLLKRRLSRRRA